MQKSWNYLVILPKLSVAVLPLLNLALQMADLERKLRLTLLRQFLFLGNYDSDLNQQIKQLTLSSLT
jgi:hypothetical protein